MWVGSCVVVLCLLRYFQMLGAFVLHLLPYGFVVISYTWKGLNLCTIIGSFWVLFRNKMCHFDEDGAEFQLHIPRHILKTETINQGWLVFVLIRNSTCKWQVASKCVHLFHLVIATRWDLERPCETFFSGLHFDWEIVCFWICALSLWKDYSWMFRFGA